MKRGYIYLVLAACCYASMGVLIRALIVDFGPFWQTFLRLIVSTLITLLIVVIAKKSFVLKHTSDYFIMLFMGIVGYGFQIMLFTLSLYHNTIGNTLFIFSAYPIFTAFLAYFILKEKITKRLIIASMLLSCVLLLLFDPNNLMKYFLGNTYALLACLTFAAYVICSRILTKRGNSPETVTLWSVALAAITSGTAAIGFETFSFDFQPISLFYLLVFGLLNAGAFNLINKGFATVNAGVGTMVLLLEPLIGSLLGLLIFHEIPSVIFMIGAVIMIITIYIATFKLE